MGPFGSILLVVAVTCGLSVRRADRFRRRGVGMAGLLLVALSALLVVALATRVALPQPSLAAGELARTGDSLDVPPLDQRLSIVLHGDLPPLAQGEAASARYILTVLSGDRAVLRRSGAFEERWKQRRVARGVSLPVLTINADRRIDLPRDLAGRPLRVRLDRLDGDLTAPLRASVVAGPPSMTAIAATGLVLVLLGALIDASERQRTSVSLQVGFLAVFGGALASGITPASQRWALVGPVTLAIVIGLSTGWWCRLLVGWLTDRLTGRAR